MNSTFLLDNDFFNSGLIEIAVERLGDRKSTKRIQVGDELKFLHREKGRILAKVTQRNVDSLQAEVLEVAAAPKRLPIRVLVGLSRPQTVKKVLQLATQIGIEELLFFEAESSQKSYASAEIWKEENLEREIRLAMEQAWDPQAPVISGPKRLNEDAFLPLTDRDEPQRILLDGEWKEGADGSEHRIEADSFILALGPEAGLTSTERNFFLENAFQTLSLGPRILRVEAALGLGLGMLLSHLEKKKL